LGGGGGGAGWGGAGRGGGRGGGGGGGPGTGQRGQSRYNRLPIKSTMSRKEGVQTPLFLDKHPASAARHVPRRSAPLQHPQPPHLGRPRAETRVVLLKTRAAVESSASDSHTGTTDSLNSSWPMQKSPAAVGRLKRACGTQGRGRHRGHRRRGRQHGARAEGGGCPPRPGQRSSCAASDGSNRSSLDIVLHPRQGPWLQGGHAKQKRALPPAPDKGHRPGAAPAARRAQSASCPQTCRPACSSRRGGAPPPCPS
jgi:hypothetical protein